ncbi:MAG: hypothetical protein ACP5QF_06945 [Desulfurella sp.]|uniref:hypothetical protein n=1 Tax=Desulfurella sp. TaxID=1962857 RepID=UPI003D10E236
MKNINAQIAKEVYDIAFNLDEKTKKSLENHVNKAILILLESGPFSMLLYCQYQIGKKGNVAVEKILKLYRKIIENNTDVLGEPTLSDNKDNNDSDYNFIFKNLERITTNFEKTIFLNQILYEALVYMKYTAKART